MIKPLTKSVWAAVLATILLFLLSTWSINILGKGHSPSHKITLTVGGICITFLLSFYGGAQTMFLASDMEPPFDTILDGLKYHKDWTFLLPYGEENMFINMFAHLFDEPDMVSVFKHAEKFRKQPLALSSAFEMLVQGKYYFLAAPNRAISVLDDESLGTLSMFCDTKSTPQAYMLPKNSPFKRSINRGITRMRNIGVLKMLKKKMDGSDDQSKFAKKQPGDKGIDLQQVSLMFYFGSGVVATVLILVTCEKFWYKKRTQKKYITCAQFFLTYHLPLWRPHSN